MAEFETFSENEDDPEVYESSGDEWEEEDKDNKGKRGNRRTSTRLSKKPRVAVAEESDEDEKPKKKSKNGVAAAAPKKKPAKKVEKEEEDEEEEEEEPEDDEEQEDEENEEGDSNDSGAANKRVAVGSKIGGNDYVNGSFLILKRDAQAGDSSKKPSLWRIDGKALLQKYEAFDEDGQVKHRNTSIYTGWSSLDKDLYHPVTVKVLQHLGQNMTVELNWEKLKEIKDEDE